MSTTKSWATHFLDSLHKKCVAQILFFNVYLKMVKVLLKSALNSLYRFVSCTFLF